MSITVDMLLQLPIMKEYSTIICGSGYTNEVQYVTVAEASSINFSNLGDKIFVLTTLSNYHDSLEETNCFIRGLCQAGISRHQAGQICKRNRFFYHCYRRAIPRCFIVYFSPCLLP